MLHPDHLLYALTARQWQDWVEFASVEPIGEERADYRTAFASAGLAACWSEGVKVKNFKVDWWEPVHVVSLDDRLKFKFAAWDAFYASRKSKNVPEVRGNER